MDQSIEQGLLFKELSRQNPAIACDRRSFKKILLKKRTFDQKNGLLGQKTDHFCALKSEMVRLRTEVRQNGPSYTH